MNIIGEDVRMSGNTAGAEGGRVACAKWAEYEVICNTESVSGVDSEEPTSVFHAFGGQTGG
jgi:hypothetical protein